MTVITRNMNEKITVTTSLSEWISISILIFDAGQNASDPI